MQQLRQHPHGATPVPASVLTLPVAALACFQRLMQYEGWDADLLRMCVDTAYAYERLATAHTSGDERLRRAALNLFEAFDRNLEFPTWHWLRSLPARRGQVQNPPEAVNADEGRA